MRAIATDRRLEAMAGPPVGMLDVYNTSVPVSVGGPLVDRILYAVVRIVSTAGNYPPVASLGSHSSTGLLRLSASIAGSENMGSRVDTVNGSANQNVAVGIGARVPGTVAIGWVQTVDGMTAAEGGWNTPARYTNHILIPGNGMDSNPPLLLHVAGSDQIPLCAVAYRGSHDIETRTRVMNWLSRRYANQPN